MWNGLEEWRDVIGYEGIYQVSNEGRVRSCDRIDASGHKRKGITRKQRKDKDGYCMVNLCKNGKVINWRVHRLVALAFIPNPENKLEINHINGNKSCNEVSNLEWVTGKENIKHALENNLRIPPHISRFGEKNSHCKLTDEQVDEIRSRYFNEEITQKELARQYNIGTTQISRIIRSEQRVYGTLSIKKETID